jgi:hypothetical protein
MTDVPVAETLKAWITLDDELRAIRERTKTINAEKQKLGENVLTFMRENAVDDFKLEGSGAGSISRSVRTSKPALRRNVVHTQILLHFSDQPEKVAEALRAIEGVAEGEDMSMTGTQKELLTRRVPRKKT